MREVKDINDYMERSEALSNRKFKQTDPGVVPPSNNEDKDDENDDEEDDSKFKDDFDITNYEK